MLGQEKPATHSQVSNLVCTTPGLKVLGQACAMDSSPWSVGGLESGSGRRRRVQGPGPTYHLPQILGSCQGTRQEAGERDYLYELPKDMAGLSREVRAHRPDPKCSWWSGGWREAPGAAGAQAWPCVIYLCVCDMLEKVPSCIKKPMCVVHTCVMCVHTVYMFTHGQCTHVYACMCAVPAAAGMGTSAGLLLGTECVALVAQAGVGAGQVPAARLPAGIRVCTFVYVCKTTRRTTAVS